MASLAATARGLEFVCQGLCSDADQQEDIVARTKDEWEESLESLRVMNAFYREIGNFDWRLISGDDGALLLWVGAFRRHIQILAVRRYKPSLEILNAAVDGMLERVDWREVSQLISTILIEGAALMETTTKVENADLCRHRDARTRLIEARRVNCRLRCTCTQLQHLVLLPVDSLVESTVANESA